VEKEGAVRWSTGRGTKKDSQGRGVRGDRRIVELEESKFRETFEGVELWTKGTGGVISAFSSSAKESGKRLL